MFCAFKMPFLGNAFYPDFLHGALFIGENVLFFLPGRGRVCDPSVQRCLLERLVQLELDLGGANGGLGADHVGACCGGHCNDYIDCADATRELGLKR